jgi:DNA-binding LacI/PurR family transcriptional regulator
LTESQRFGTLLQYQQIIVLRESPMASKAEEARHRILEQLRTGSLRPGQRLESEREMARQMGMNHQTVRRALAELVEEGLIVKRPRMGTFVRDGGSTTSVAAVFPRWFLDKSVRPAAAGVELEWIIESLDSPVYAVSVLSYRPDRFWDDAGQAILARGIRGILLWESIQIPAEAIGRLLDAGVQIVALTHHAHLSGLGFSSYMLDQGPVLAELLQGLVERGHRRIVVVRFSTPATPTLNSVIEEAADRLGLGEGRELSLWLPNARQLDYAPLETLFERRPTAVIAPDECVAAEIFRRCYRRGVRIGEDLSLAARQDLTPRAHPVPLTAPDTEHWSRQTARRAGEHLRRLLEGERLERVEVRLSGPVRWTRSVAICDSVMVLKGDFNPFQEGVSDETRT